MTMHHINIQEVSKILLLCIADDDLRCTFLSFLQIWLRELSMSLHYGPNIAPSMTLWSHIQSLFICPGPRSSGDVTTTPSPQLPVSLLTQQPTPIDPRSPWSRQSPLIANFIYVLISFGWLSSPPPAFVQT